MNSKDSMARTILLTIEQYGAYNTFLYSFQY